MNTKTCARCLCEKPLTEFEKTETGIFRSQCRECRSWKRKYYQANRESEITRATKHQNADRNKTNKYKRDQMRKHPERYLCQSAKSRAKKTGIPFDLTTKDIIIPPVCPILGIPLKINDALCGPDSPSLDRIIPELGYVKGNVLVLSHRANTIKSDATLEELKQVVAFLEEHQKKLSAEQN